MKCMYSKSESIEHLLIEAKNRYSGGCWVNSIDNNSMFDIQVYDEFIYTGGCIICKPLEKKHILKGRNISNNNCRCVFKDGKWADIIRR